MAKLKILPYSIKAELVSVSRQSVSGDWSCIPIGRLSLLSARPAVTFQTAEHHRRLTGTKLYCLLYRGTVLIRVIRKNYCDLWPLVTLILGQNHSQSNRLVPELYPIIPCNFIKIWLIVFFSNPVNKQTDRRVWKHNRVFDDNNVNVCR